MRCRSGLRYNEKAGTYDQYHGEHYTEEHDKLHPAQASAKQIILDEASPWRDRHPLADTDLSVTEDEWDALAAEGHFPPCRTFLYTTTTRTTQHPLRRPPWAPCFATASFVTRSALLATRLTTTPVVFEDEPVAAAPVDSFQDEIVLFAACVFLFLAATWAFGTITTFATPTSVFVTPNFPVQTTSLVTWSPISHTCAVGTCLLSMTVLLSILLGGLLVVVLYPSLLVTAITWVRFSVRVQTQLQEPAVPEAHMFTPIRPSTASTDTGDSMASRYATPTVFSDEEQVYHNS
jgi:hypothetical protein